MTCIISGGQTGVDRAALDVAIELGLAHGGWCPRGRCAEDGPIPERYQLTETHETDCETRTRRNVDHSNGTLIFHSPGCQSPGTDVTMAYAKEKGKPWHVIECGQDPRHAIEDLKRFLAQNAIRKLNVAGPRESEAPHLVPFVRTILAEALAPSAEHA